jgi:signal-transduction protein with cAMP-binding, CBS, and nucleotidyltransferase domain
MKLMTHHRVRHMPVLRDGELAGIISIGDVVKSRLDDLELESNVQSLVSDCRSTLEQARLPSRTCCSRYYTAVPRARN